MFADYRRKRRGRAADLTARGPDTGRHAVPSPCGSGKASLGMHGGAKGLGAPRGNRNALKHALYKREAIAERRKLRQLIKRMEGLLEEIA